MLKNALTSLHVGGTLYLDDFPYLGFIERAQTFHLGVISLVEQGNPLAAVTLLRAYAENAAIAFWIDKNPQDLQKLRPGATQGLPICRVIAEAERHLPGFKARYSRWSEHAHPSGSEGFHTLKISAAGGLRGNPNPTSSRLRTRVRYSSG